MKGIQNKFLKMVLEATLLNIQHHKVWIKGKWSNQGKGVVPSHTPLYLSYTTPVYKSGTRAFLRWVRSQNRSPHASGLAKNIFGPIGIPLIMSGSGVRQLTPLPKGVKSQGNDPLSPPIHLGVVAIEKGALWSPSTKVANFIYYIYIYIYSAICKYTLKILYESWFSSPPKIPDFIFSSLLFLMKPYTIKIVMIIYYLTLHYWNCNKTKIA